MAAMGFTGCMKHSTASCPSVSRTSRTSAMEAVSKWVMPACHSSISRSGEGFAFTA